MIKTTIAQYKHGIVIIFEDDGWQQVTQLKWHEAIGLYHELKDAVEHPRFKRRDPRRPRNVTNITNTRAMYDAREEPS